MLFVLRSVCIAMHGSENIQRLYVVCILVRHPDDGRRSDRNVSANMIKRMLSVCICWFVT